MRLKKSSKILLFAGALVVMILALSLWQWSQRSGTGSIALVEYRRVGSYTNVIFAIPMPPREPRLPPLGQNTVLSVEWTSGSRNWGRSNLAQYNYVQSRRAGELWVSMPVPDRQEWKFRIQVHQRLVIRKPGRDWLLPIRRVSPAYETRWFNQKEIPGNLKAE